MKKILIILALFLLTGCSSIDDTSVTNLINDITISQLNLSNTYRKGYKYYMPNNLQIKDVEGFNEKIVHKNYNYYLYVDIVSYFNNIKKDYTINNDAYISLDISKGDINGYLEVNRINDKYLIEIMYNYAKIELIVDIDYLKEGITNSLIILSTIVYNNDIIDNMMGDDVLNFNEESLNIFEVQAKESNFLKYDQEYDTYEEKVHDPDLIN